MRKLFALLYAAVMIASLFVAVARSISSSPAETPASYALEAEDSTPGLSEVKERLACASCSAPVDYTRSVETDIVRDHSICVANKKHCGACLLVKSCIYGNCNHRHEFAIAIYGADHLKLPSVAVVEIKNAGLTECTANTANLPRVEVLGVGVCSWPDRRSAPMISGI